MQTKKREAEKKVLQDDKAWKEKEYSGNGSCKGTCLFHMGHDDRQHRHGVISECHPSVKGK